eukprot:SAG25_NODE_1924_length_2141_cov_6.004897_1_plen_713_part_11
MGACTISESESANLTVAGREGNCNVDVDECTSNPCTHGGLCYESLTSTSVLFHSYLCNCPPGWTGTNCALHLAECSSMPCQNGGVCHDSRSDSSIAYGSYTCYCAAGFANGMCSYQFLDRFRPVCEIAEGGNCDLDIDECSSSPCQNGATCVESQSIAMSSNAPFVHPNKYECSCSPGFARGLCAYSYIVEYTSDCAARESGGNCDVDVDECASSPCQNYASCVDSRDDRTIPYDSYRCLCNPGTVNGHCAYDFVGFYDYVCGDAACSACTVSLGGNCNVDVDECASHPCSHGQCIQSGHSGAVAAHGLLIYGSYTCKCDQGYAGGICEYDFILEYVTHCNVHLDGNCDIDVDECRSNPCQNGAACVESSGLPGIPPHTYRCICAPGFADGWCNYTFIQEYSAVCSIQNSGSTSGGNCGVDVNECASNPCVNGATCTESTSLNLTITSYDTPWHTFYDTSGDGSWTDAKVEFDSYSCSCAAGFTNGVCEYNFLPEVTTQCHVWIGANCNVDVNECASNPCVNGAVCEESSSDLRGLIQPHAYMCECVAGFANGHCIYDYVQHYASLCLLVNALSAQSTCNIDVDECISRPCENGGSCVESSARVTISPDAYVCECAPGWTNGICNYDYPSRYTEDCSRNGSAHNANCNIDLDECVSSPCENGAVCVDSSSNVSVPFNVPANSYTCVCSLGFSNGFCRNNMLRLVLPDCSIFSG